MNIEQSIALVYKAIEDKLGEDIKILKGYEQDGIEGVIVGKAIYTDNLSLQEAIKIAKEG